MNRKNVSFLSGLLIVTIPSSLAIWYFFFLNLIDHQITTSPMRVFNCFFISISFAVYALRRKSVDITGAISGCLFAMIFTYAIYGFLFALISVFFVSSKATKYKGDIKSQFEEDYHKSSQRNWVQVVCNLGVAAQFAVFCLIESGPGAEMPLDFQQYFTSSCLIVGVLGAFSCSLGDTLASELGTVLSYGDPVLITTFRKVPKGTNGGVSLTGLLVSGLGGLTIGLCYLVSLYLFIDEKKVLIAYPQWPILLITFASGLYGSVLDSYLGAIFQFSGVNMKTGKIASRPGLNVNKISGLNLLDNHIVNLLATLITPVFAIIFSIYTYQFLTVSSS